MLWREIVSMFKLDGRNISLHVFWNTFLDVGVQ